jgi:hypothetical protein
MLTRKIGRPRVLRTYWKAFRDEPSLTRKWLGAVVFLVAFPLWFPVAAAMMLLFTLWFVGMWLWTGACNLGVALRSEEYRDAREQRLADQLTALQRKMHMEQREVWDVMHNDDE